MNLAGRCSAAIRSVCMASLAFLAGCATSAPPPAPAPPSLFSTDVSASIPATLGDCLRILERTLPGDLQAEMRNGREEHMIRYHMTVGRWIRNEWLEGYGEKALRRWFETNYRVEYPDDISSIVLRSFWRHLNDRPLDVEGMAPEVRAWNARHLPPPPPPQRSRPQR